MRNPSDEPLDRHLFRILLFLLPVQLGYHWWPVWSFVMGRRVDYLSPTLFLTDLLILAVLSSYTLRTRRFIGRIGTAPALLFLVMVVLNTVFSVSPPVSLYKWLKLLEFVGLGWYVIQTKPRLSTVAFWLSGAALWSGLLAITQFLLAGSVGGMLWMLGERTFSLATPGIARMDACTPLGFSCVELLRPYATFPHPNVLAGFLGTVLILASPYVFTKTEVVPDLFTARFERFVIRISFAVSLLVIFLTFSRSAWIALAVVLSVPAFRRRKLLSVAAVLAAVALVSKYTGLFVPGQSVNERLQLLSASVPLFLSRPLTGTGLGSFIPALSLLRPNASAWLLQPVHSVYALLLAETGIAGVAFLAYVLLRTRKLFRGTASPARPVLTFILLVGLADHYFLTLQQGQILTTLIVALVFLSPPLPAPSR